MNVELIGLDDFSLDEKDIISHTVIKILNAADLGKYYINISFVDKKTIKQLYLQFKGEKKVTDVLSFPTPQMERIFDHSKYFLGDVVICIEKAKAQALELGHSLVEEIAVLTAHGLFHLLGYDHELSHEEANIQMQGEMYLLEKVGLRAELCLIGRV